MKIWRTFAIQIVGFSHLLINLTNLTSGVRKCFPDIFGLHSFLQRKKIEKQTFYITTNFATFVAIYYIAKYVIVSHTRLA